MLRGAQRVGSDAAAASAAASCHRPCGWPAISRSGQLRTFRTGLSALSALARAQTIWTRIPSSTLSSPAKTPSHHNYRPSRCRVLCTSSTTASPLSSASSTSQLRPQVPLSLPQLSLHKSQPGSRASFRKRFLPVTLPIMHSHSHGGGGHHHHHHDNTYLVSSNKNDAGVRITRIGLYVNLGMAVTKGIGGVMFNSQALVADAWHALTDLVSDFLTLATISVALKPPTGKYPNGFGKVESFGSLLVSGLLLVGGLVMAKHSAESLYLQFAADAAQQAHDHAHHAHDHSHGMFGHSHSARDMIPDVKAAWLAAGSIIVKEWLYRATKKIARERQSAVLDSNAVHHRVDSLTSLVALLAIGGANIWESATWLDPVGGLIVAVMIIQAGWGNTAAAVYELCDSSVDDEIKNKVKKAASKVFEERGKGYQIRSVEGTKAGQNYLIDIQVAVPNALSLTQLDSIESLVRDSVGHKVRGVRRLRVKFTAEESDAVGFTDEFIPGDVSLEPEENSHDHDHDHDHSHDHSHQQSGRANGSATKRR